jgi:hypothetical protein
MSNQTSVGLEPPEYYPGNPGYRALVCGQDDVHSRAGQTRVR